MPKKTLRKWPAFCSCGFTGSLWGWDYELPLPCPTCKQSLEHHRDRNKSAAIATDDIPGGIEIRHGEGIINPDGSPKRYYSKTELKRACNEAGWTISGDTPRPYHVNWSGKTREER